MLTKVWYLTCSMQLISITQTSVFPVIILFCANEILLLKLRKLFRLRVHAPRGVLCIEKSRPTAKEWLTLMCFADACPGVALALAGGDRPSAGQALGQV